jgi:hypothetical protein
MGVTMTIWDWAELLVDFGIPAALAAAGHVVIRLGKRGYRQQAARQCPWCRYDMRASQGLVCPECGKFCKSQKFIEHGRVRWWWVACGWAMFVPLAWAVLLTMVTGLMVLFADTSIDQAAGDYQDPVSGEVVRVEATVGLFHGFGEPMKPNPVAKWVFWQLRYWLDKDFAEAAQVVAFSDRSASIAGDAQMHLDGMVYQDTGIFGLAPVSHGLMCCPADGRSLVWARFLAHGWVCPVRHYKRYFTTEYPSDTLLVRIVDAKTMKAAELNDPQTGRAMPDEHGGTLAPQAVEKIGKTRDLKHVVFIGVSCNESVMRALGAQRSLLSLRMSHVTASDAAVAKVLGEMTALRSLNLSFDRPLTDGDVAALASCSSAVLSDVTWTGKAMLRDESVAILLRLKNVKFDGTVCLERSTKLVEVLREFKRDAQDSWGRRVTSYPNLKLMLQGQAASEMTEDDINELRARGTTVVIDVDGGVGQQRTRD